MEKRITRRRFGSVVTATAAAPGIANRARAAAPPAQHTTVGDGDVGAVLSSGKPYFPMLLGNGMEHVLIGYSGAMGACAGHEHWSYGTTNTGWFGPDRRTRPSRGVLNLLQCGYIVRRGIHADGIDTVEQVFDARTGSLVTECRFANAGIRVRSFLTANHLLVHRFTVPTAHRKHRPVWMPLTWACSIA